MDTTATAAPQHPLLALCERLGVRLDDLGDPGLWSLSDSEVADLVAATETQLRRLASWQTRAVAEARRRDLPKQVGATSMTAWLSGTLTITPQRAHRLDRLAQALDVGVPATADAFAAGDVDAEQADTIAGAVHALPDSVGDDTRDRAEGYLLDQARTQHAKNLAGLGAHLLEVVAPDHADQLLRQKLERDEACETFRKNTFTGTVDRFGTMRLRGVLDPESWAQVQAALGPLARPCPATEADEAGIETKVPDRRTVGQRHADALVELCRRALAHSAACRPAATTAGADTTQAGADLLPTAHGFPAHVAITIDHDTLVAGVGVGMLDTGVPISASAVRRICCDATVIPTLLSGAGVPLDVGRAERVFRKELRRAIVIRDIGCAFPGCARPAAWCQVHHIVHWLDLGETCLDNGVLLCGAHHRLVHHGDWQVRMAADRRPEFLPPAWIDPDRRPLRNTCHLRC